MFIQLFEKMLFHIKKNKKVKQLSDVAILLKKYYRCYTMRNYRINSSRAEAIEEYF